VAEWRITYYNEAVRASIEAWPVGTRAVYARITERIQALGPNLGMPYTRALGDGLFEIRAQRHGASGRALFCMVVGRTVIVLDAFLKKTPKTPQRALALARRRMKEVNFREDA